MACQPLEVALPQSAPALHDASPRLARRVIRHCEMNALPFWSRLAYPRTNSSGVRTVRDCSAISPGRDRAEGEEMSESPEIDARISGVVEDYIQRAMACGFTRDEAQSIIWKSILNESDRIARERRSRFKVV